MTRTEYNQRVITRKKRSILIKGSLGIAAFLMFASIVGHIDSDVYAGIHSVKGTVSASGNYILDENGKAYDVSGFQSGSEVTVKLDKQGNILSVVSKQKRGDCMEHRYKLRIYFKSGAQKGNLKREEFFDSLDAMNKRYRELFKPKEYALNPTAWEKVNEEWLRMFITSAA